MTRMAHTLSSFVLALAVSGTAFAQRGMGAGPMHYNRATETTLNGVVDEVKEMAAGGRGMGGIHLMFTAERGPIEVHVGPAAYISAQGFAFAKGDALTIVGSKVTMNGTDVVLAREIRLADRVLTLRDDKGFPRWSGRGRGR